MSRQDDHPLREVTWLTRKEVSDALSTGELNGYELRGFEKAKLSWRGGVATMDGKFYANVDSAAYWALSATPLLMDLAESGDISDDEFDVLIDELMRCGREIIRVKEDQKRQWKERDEAKRAARDVRVD